MGPRSIAAGMISTPSTPDGDDVNGDYEADLQAARAIGYDVESTEKEIEKEEAPTPSSDQDKQNCFCF